MLRFCDEQANDLVCVSGVPKKTLQAAVPVMDTLLAVYTLLVNSD
jgi:hypothetical protein